MHTADWSTLDRFYIFEMHTNCWRYLINFVFVICMLKWFRSCDS